jgi:hypothetical protein
VSIPLAFFLGWLGSVTDKHPADPTRFARIQVRALTGHRRGAREPHLIQGSAAGA